MRAPASPRDVGLHLLPMVLSETKAQQHGSNYSAASTGADEAVDLLRELLQCRLNEDG